MKELNISIIHDKNVKVKVYFNDILQKNKEEVVSSSVCAYFEYNELLRVRIEQYHTFTSKLWWLYLFLIFPFLQGFFSNYEYNFLNDYYDIIEFDVFTNKNIDILLNLEKKIYSEKVESNFYFNPVEFIKGRAAMPIFASKAINAYFFEFKLLKKNAELHNFLHKSPSEKFIFKWKLIRFWPVLITYGSLFVCCIFSMFNKLSFWSIIGSILMLLIIISEFLNIINFSTKPPENSSVC